MKTVRTIAFLVLAGAALAAAGCASRGRSEGVPPEMAKAKFIGGGREVQFTAPEPGMALVWDNGDRRLIASKAMQKGETVLATRSAIMDEQRTAHVIADGNSDDIRLFFLPEREYSTAAAADAEDAPAPSTGK